MNRVYAASLVVGLSLIALLPLQARTQDVPQQANPVDRESVPGFPVAAFVMADEIPRRNDSRHAGSLMISWHDGNFHALAFFTSRDRDGNYGVTQVGDFMFKEFSPKRSHRIFTRGSERLYIPCTKEPHNNLVFYDTDPINPAAFFDEKPVLLGLVRRLSVNLQVSGQPGSQGFFTD